MKPSGLIYVIGQLRPGGQEQQLCYLLSAMDRERYRPEVVVWSFREEEIHVADLRALGVMVHAMEPGISPARKLAQLAKLVRARAPDVVHSYCYFTNLPVWLATRGGRSVAMGSVRNDLRFSVAQLGDSLGRLSAVFPRWQIHNSHRSAEQARAWPLAARSVVVLNGIDLARFRVTPPPHGDCPQILAVGSLLPQKRWDRLLDIAQQLKRRNLRFHLRIVGDGPLRATLAEKARSLGLDGCVAFLGFSPHVADLLAESAFLVHTSDAEGSPNAVMEAMSAGRAVVATDVGDVPRIVADGQHGFVVPANDPNAFALRMERLLRDPELCRRFGEAGRAHAQAEFSLERLVQGTLAAYREAGAVLS